MSRAFNEGQLNTWADFADFDAGPRPQTLQRDEKGGNGYNAQGKSAAPIGYTVHVSSDEILPSDRFMRFFLWRRFRPWLTGSLMKHRQKILKLRPTQFAVGMLEVEEKIKVVRQFNRKQIRDFVNDNPVPVVMGPDKNLYVVDHHHFLAVCYYIGIKKVQVKVVRNLSRRPLSYAQFWKWMFKTRNAYPFCQFGEGPRKAIYLPKDIRGLADDPYRSLAWFVRKAGGFKNSEKNFAEFKWANFFRSRRLLDRYGLAGMQNALKNAVFLAQSPAAKSLPGFGKLHLRDKGKAKEKVKKKGAELARLIAD